MCNNKAFDYKSEKKLQRKAIKTQIKLQKGFIRFIFDRPFSQKKMLIDISNFKRIIDVSKNKSAKRGIATAKKRTNHDRCS